MDNIFLVCDVIDMCNICNVNTGIISESESESFYCHCSLKYNEICVSSSRKTVQKTTTIEI